MLGRQGGRAGLTVPIVAANGCIWEVFEAERQLLDHVLVMVRGIDVDRLGHDARLRQQLDALNRGHLERHDARLARGGAVLPHVLHEHFADVRGIYDLDVLLDLARPGLVVRHELRGAVRLRVVRVGADVLVGPQVDLDHRYHSAYGQRSRLWARL